MSFRSIDPAATLALLALGATLASAQYSTPVGSGAAKPKTLRATAILEWTGSLEKPNASRLMPLAVWDGEHYQPAGLYLARPAPLAFESGTQYQLERSGELAGLFDVRGAAQLHGEWIGLGRFQPEAAPPPPPKLKPSKHLPVRSNGKADTQEKADASSGADAKDSDRPTLHRKTGSDSSTPTGSAPSTGSSTSQTNNQQTRSKSGADSQPAATPTKPADSTSTAPADASADSDRPTLHRRADTASTTGGNSTAPDAPEATSSPDPDRPTLHRHDDASKSSDAGSDRDPDRPTLHRAKTGSEAVVSIDPDRPHLRYGPSAGADGTVTPVRLEGVPPAMQQIVGVSDATTGDPRPYQYHWADPGDAAKMQSALATIAAHAAARPNAAGHKPAQFGPASRAAASKATARKATAGKPASGGKQAQGPSPAASLVDEHFTAYELSFSGGATLVYSAHTAEEGAQRVFVTLIAQPDFNGKPQILLQQVARADRLDETPSMQLVDALDTDNDQRAELIFQLNSAIGESPVELAPGGAVDNPGDPAPGKPAAALPAATPTAMVSEREFAIYRVANGKAVQVFNTGPLP